MKEILWTSRADSRLQSELEALSGKSVRASNKLAAQMLSAVDVLRRFPDAGYLLTQDELRKFAVPGTDYVLLYRNMPETVRILALYHGREDWSTKYFSGQ